VVYLWFHVEQIELQLPFACGTYPVANGNNQGMKGPLYTITQVRVVTGDKISSPNC